MPSLNFITHTHTHISKCGLFSLTELYQTELHHVRTLRIMWEVYYKGLQKDLQPDTPNLDKVHTYGIIGLIIIFTC